MRESCDRTADVMAGVENVEIWCMDYCDAFEQDKSRLFSSKECWYCVHGSFFVYTSCPKREGVCGYTSGIKQQSCQHK